MARVDFGPTVLNGVLQRTSASAITTADPNTYGGCFRKFFYDKVLGLKEPETEPQKLGKKCHKEIEDHLIYDTGALSAIVMAGYQFIPDRDPLLEIEHNITPQHFYEVAGVPVVGMLDIINPTGRYISPMGEYILENLVEVLDWKTTSDISYVKAGHLLKTLHQMVLYGEYTSRRYNADRVRLSHVYFQTKRTKKSEKTTTILTREDSYKHWPKMERVVRTLIDLAPETDINKVPANTSSCTAFKGCFYSDRCPKTQTMIMDMITGNTQKMTQIPPVNYIPPASPLATPPAIGVPVAPPAGTFPIVQTPGGVVAQIPLTALVAPPSAGVPTAGGVPIPERPADFVAAMNFVYTQGKGRPALAGEAQSINAAYNAVGLGPSGETPGEGMAAATIVSTTQEMLHLATAVGVRDGVPFVAPANVLPDDAPASQPHLAADPVEGYTVPPAPAAPAPPYQSIQPQVAAPVAPPVAQQPPPPPAAPEAPQGSSDIMTKALQAAEDGKWGSVKKPEIAAAFCELLAQKSGAPAVVNNAAAASLSPTKVSVYLNCIREGALDLAAHIDATAAEICKQYGVVNLLAAPKDSALGYSAWKGILISTYAEAVKALAPGDYYLITGSDEIKQVAAMALTANIEACGI